MVMKLRLRRVARKESYTIGKLEQWVNGSWQWLADTLEDTDRGLKQSMTTKEIAAIKIKGVTAIPTGEYEVTMNVISPKYSAKPWFVEHANGARMPRLLNIPGYQGVLIHCGNTAKDTDGCILIGENKEVGKLINSRDTFLRVYPILQKAAWQRGETIKITIS